MINKKFHCQKISNFLPSDFQNIDHHENIKFQFFFHFPFFKNLFVLKKFFQEIFTFDNRNKNNSRKFSVNDEQFELEIFTEIFIYYNKQGCVLPMFVVSILPHAAWGPCGIRSK